MFNSQRHKALLCLKGIVVRIWPIPNPNCYRLLPHDPSPFSQKYSTNTFANRSFRVSYLIDNFGFSPEAALTACKVARFKSLEKPDSVLSFLRNRGFSDSQINVIIRKEPWLLSCDPDKRLMPKFEFLHSKGVSSSDIVRMVNRSPRFLQKSLENQIIPSYELLETFLQSDEEIIACIKYHPSLLYQNVMPTNVQILVDNGVVGLNVTRLLRRWPKILLESDLDKTVKELKDLGFNPSKVVFVLALLAKRSVSKSQWDSKVDSFKRWGWSEEAVLQAFKNHPGCMLVSKDKIDAVMRFWVNQLGWESLMLVRKPEILAYSLAKKIIPRASVLQHLLLKGLINQNGLLSPFGPAENLFLQKYVMRFEKERSKLLEVYEEKKKLSNNRENSGV
ncbi:hypothetical protein L6164_025475 [Bauhinia variegata]|uniref:Uncharacterized protein n=1 Tax=Bauhinia variegata TaxID=167791 RepID=A0ACB9M0M6_BAUVA|nr:hypothetical protein L6164_025475 [Bauhinia variegata]